MKQPAFRLFVRRFHG